MSYLQNYLQNNNIRNYMTQKNSGFINFKKIKSQFCPFQRFVDHRPNPYRPVESCNLNVFNYPTEKEKFVSCYKFIDKRKLHPLITREDLVKYMRQDSAILRHRNPCNSCIKINSGNYGSNYYSIFKKSFPFIKGNFCGNLTKYIPRYNTPINSRNVGQKFKYKFTDNKNYSTEEKNIKNMNVLTRTCNVNQMEERKNDKNDGNKLNELLKKSEGIRLKFLSRNNSINYFYRPMTRRSFHKTQIFNHCKPFLVDEFRAYAENKKISD